MEVALGVEGGGGKWVGEEGRGVLFGEKKKKREWTRIGKAGKHPQITQIYADKKKSKRREEIHADGGSGGKIGRASSRERV